MKGKHADRWTDTKAQEIEAEDDRHKGGSYISSVVTSQRDSMKEILRVRKGITRMMPGKTDFCDRNNKHIGCPAQLILVVGWVHSGA